MDRERENGKARIGHRTQYRKSTRIYPDSKTGRLLGSGTGRDRWRSDLQASTKPDYDMGLQEATNPLVEILSTCIYAT